MKNTTSKVLFLLSASMLLAGCSNTNPNISNSPDSNQTSSFPEVWSTYSSRKVVMATDRNDSLEKMPGEINISLYQGEKEDAQLILTSSSNEKKAYSLAYGTLKNKDGVEFPKEKVQIYHQKYIKVAKTHTGNRDYFSGDSIPDMLLPMDTAIKNDENYIQPLSNQGVTVEFDSTGLPEGTYTGTFLLIVGKETKEVPVSVKVWDFSYEGRRTFQSSFLLYRNQLLAGEYDSSDEMVQSYVDFMLDYKVNTYVIKDKNEWTTENVVNEAKRLYSNMNYNSIVIPFDFPLTYRAFSGDQLTSEASKVVDYILGLAKESKGDDNYLKLAYFYPSTYDEADINHTEIQSETFFGKKGEYHKTLEEAAKRIDTDSSFSELTPEKKASLKQDILNIPAVFTNVDYQSKWVGTLGATFCPYFSVYNDEATLQRYQDAAKKDANGNLWAYTCMGPNYPYGTFHIDDSTLGMRTSGWMEKAFGLTGYLYYAYNMATQFRLSEEVYTDVYENPLRYEEVPGDGYLVYPGRFYNSKTPFASLRLLSYRDSQDDYDMLCIYENLVNEYAKKHSVEVSFSSLVNDLYADIFQGAIYYEQDRLLFEAREELANRILSLKNEDKLIEKTGTIKTFDTNKVVVSDGSEISFADNVYKATMKPQFKDKGENIGSQTKIFRPAITLSSTDLAKTQEINFDYTNEGDEEMNMIINLVDKTGYKTQLISNYASKGEKRTISMVLSDSLLKQLSLKREDISALEVSFDNVVYNEKGEVSLAPNQKISICNLSMRVAE
ncbi:MAG: DUF4091 domain-containing protein [Mollicutes bacterium]|nr:DUF4091 domain-containing protein [Mollicutes bacterium]MDY6071148.1 DUF4091 domain-containing protein [Bacilli bacterium]